MIQVAFVIAPYVGHLNSSFGIAFSLAQRGHRVTYLGDDFCRARVESQGFRFEEVPFLRSLALDRPARSAGGWMARFRERRAAARRRLTDADGIPSAASALSRRLAIDVMVFDPFLLCYYFPFQMLGIPAVSLSTKPLLDADPLVPPYTSWAIPSPAGLRRLRVALAWTGCRLTYARYKLGAALARALDGYSPMMWVRRLARLCDYPLRAEAAMRPVSFDFRLKSVPEMVLAAREFDFPRAKPLNPTTRFVGPCVYARRREIPFDWAAVPERTRLVYCSLGTVRAGRDEIAVRFLKRVIQAFANDEDVALIIATSDAKVKTLLVPWPSHTSVHETVPQIEVLSRASVMITHGGSSSIKECVLARVPMVVYPRRADQPGNAARVVFHGLGLRGRMKSETADAIRRKVRGLFTDGNVSRHLESMRTAFLRCDEAHEEVTMIEQLVAATPLATELRPGVVRL